MIMDEQESNKEEGNDLKHYHIPDKKYGKKRTRGRKK